MLANHNNINNYSIENITEFFSTKNPNFKDIYNRYSTQYPLDIEGLCKEIGLKINRIASTDEHSGSYDGDKTIIVNGKHNINRQRFTIAHELGHYLLHNGIKHRHNLIHYGIQEKKEESEANLFARSILMPAEEIDSLLTEKKDLIYDGKVNFVGELVDKFHVSTDALRVRLITLGLIEGW